MNELNQLRLMPWHLVNHHGPAVLVTALTGFIGGGIEGFYYRQTRFLSRLRFTIGGEEPGMVAATPVSSHAAIAYYLARSPAGAKAGPQAERDSGGGEMVRRAIEVRINRVLAGGLRHLVVISNHALAEAEVALRWEFDADFADLSEAAQGRRQQEAWIERRWSDHPGGGELYFGYCHPQLRHGCEVRLSGDGRLRGADRSIVWTVNLAPQASRRLVIEVVPVFCGERVAARDVEPSAAMREPEVLLSAADPVVQAAWQRSVGDLASLALLDGEGIEQRLPAAGIPKFAALFGRDALVAGFQAGIIDPPMLLGTVRRIAAWNATRYDDAYDAEPGRVIHQHQQSPLALLNKNPFLHYYGDYSAPGWLLIDAAWGLGLTGDRQAYLALRDSVVRTLRWMDRDGDRDKDGFYEYAPNSPRGEKNQGWKDSREAILYPNGQIVPDPIALVDIQGCYFAAKQMTALAFEAIGERDRASELRAEAAALKRRFNEGFWMEDERYYALALDATKRQVASITADAGHCLTYGIVDEDKAPAVADRLMSPELFTGWGIRTLSSRHPAYNPFAYHLGSVWPVSNALIAFGLKRYGFNTHLHRLARALFDATRLFELRRLPEVFGGHDRDPEHPHPGIYPEANAPQAWSAGAVVMLTLAMVGLVPLAPLATLIVDPDLPDWLPELTLRGIRIGEARVSLRFRRGADGRSEFEVLDQQGRLRLHRPPAGVPGSDRLGRAVRALIAGC